tara:strand:- start:325 stop:522 length:198 start_codon:yes stop_codon:yes gene_type:complete
MSFEDIPASTFRFWAACFRERTLHDEYADDLAEFLEFAANAAEFEDALEEAYDHNSKPKYDRLIN